MLKKDSYIIRIYRRDEKDPERLFGLIEDIGEGKRKPFHNTNELNFILTGQCSDSREGILKERRRAERLKLKLPVILRGTDIAGKNFTEKTYLNDLSSSGAYLYISSPVSRETGINMLIDPDRSNLNVDARIVRIKNSSEIKGVGVSFNSKL